MTQYRYEERPASEPTSFITGNHSFLDTGNLAKSRCRLLPLIQSVNPNITDTAALIAALYKLVSSPKFHGIYGRRFSIVMTALLAQANGGDPTARVVFRHFIEKFNLARMDSYFSGSIKL